MGTYTAAPQRIEVNKTSWPHKEEFLTEYFLTNPGRQHILIEKTMIWVATDLNNNTIIYDIKNKRMLLQGISHFSDYMQIIPNDSTTSVMNRYQVYRDFVLNKIVVYKDGMLTYIIDQDPWPVRNLRISKSGAYIIWNEARLDGYNHWIIVY